MEEPVVVVATAVIVALEQLIEMLSFLTGKTRSASECSGPTRTRCLSMDPWPYLHVKTLVYCTVFPKRVAFSFNFAFALRTGFH